MPMQPVVQITSYGQWDQLHGVTLREGEMLNIQWPDGLATRHVCHIEKLRGDGIDKVTYEQAYITDGLYGASCRVYLHQPGLLCERTGA